MSKKIIILEELSFLSLIYLILIKGFVYKVFIFKSNQILNEYIKIKKNYLYKIFKFFFDKKTIKVDTKILENFTYSSNILTNNYLKNSSLDEINKSLLEKKIKSSKYIIALKKYLIPHVQSKFRLYLLYRYFKKNFDEEILILPIYEDILKIYKKSKLKKINFIENQKFFLKFTSLKKFLKLFSLQILWLLKCIINGFHLKNKIKEYDFGYHIAYGLKKNQRDFEVLSNLKKKKIKLLIIFSIWKNHKKNPNIDFESCDEFKNSSNLFFFLKDILPTFLKINLNALNYNYLDFDITFQLLKSYYGYEVFCQNYKVKNFISRDDYSINHILRTIVFNKHGLKNIGIQHSAFIKPMGINYICFDYFDKYFTYNEINKLIYDKFSFSRQVIPVGTIWVDNILRNKEKNKEAFYRLYSKSKNIIVFFPSLNNLFINYDSLNEKYKFLLYFLEHKENYNIFIQLRKKELKNLKNFFNKFSYLEKYKDRLIFESEFLTSELINYADAVVSNDSSTITLEALSINKKNIILLNSRFQFNKILPWFDIEKSFICQSSLQVEDKLKNLLKNEDYILNNYAKIFNKNLNLDKRNIWDQILSHL